MPLIYDKKFVDQINETMEMRAQAILEARAEHGGNEESPEGVATELHVAFVDTQDSIYSGSFRGVAADPNGLYPELEYAVQVEEA